MYLQLSGKLINMHQLTLFYLAYISMFLSFVLALVQLDHLGQADEDSQSSLWLQAKWRYFALYSLFVGYFLLVTLIPKQSLPKAITSVAAGSSKEIQQDTWTANLVSQTRYWGSYFTKSAYESEMKQAVKKYVDKK